MRLEDIASIFNVVMCRDVIELSFQHGTSDYVNSLEFQVRYIVPFSFYLKISNCKVDAGIENLPRRFSKKRIIAMERFFWFNVLH